MIFRNSAIVRGLLLASAGSITVGLSSAAFAQTGPAPEEGASGVPTIIVTAQRYEQELQDTPLSIVALDADGLEAMGVENIDDFDTFIPNLSIGGTSGQGNAIAAFSIRGIGGAPGGFVTQEGAVGVYVDDILFARPNGALLDLLDVERVEVLRGPQGTLFGRNTAGGAVRYVSKMPEFDDVSGSIRAGLGSYNRRDIRGYINVPLADNLAARLSVGYKSKDGYITRLINGDKAGDEQSTTMRLQLRWQPTDKLEINLSADTIRTEDDGSATIIGSNIGFPGYSMTDIYPNALYCSPGDGSFPPCNPTVQAQAQALVPAGASPSGYTDRDADLAFFTSGINDGYTVYGSSTPDLNKLESIGLASTISYELTDDIVFKSLTGYRETDQIQNQDWDRLPIPIYGLNEDIYIKYFTQEFQILGNSFDNRLNWAVGGFYYWDEALDYRRRLGGSAASNSQYADDGSIFANLADGVGLGALEQKFITTESVAVFAQGTFEFTDEFSATAGLRWSRDNKDFTVFREGRGRVNNIALPHSVKGNWSNLSPRISLQYAWTPDVMTYVSASRGFKGGGFNDSPSSRCAIGDESACGITEFQPENLWTYEAGIRSEFLDRRVRLNLTGFLTKYSDLQIQYIEVNPIPTQFTVNGDSTVKGFEGELVVNPADGLLLRGSVGFTDSQYDADVVDGGVVKILKDAPYFRSPRWSYSLGASYTTAMSDSGDLSVDLNWGWKSSMSSTATPTNTVILGSYGLLNGRVEYKSDAGWSLAVVGNNLLDEYYLTGGFDPGGPNAKPSPGSNLAHDNVFGFTMLDVGRPREFGVELSFEF